MRLLILGGTGMMGHALWTKLSANHCVGATVRIPKKDVPAIPKINRDLVFEYAECGDIWPLAKIILEFKPDVVFNCIGLVKQLDAGKNHLASVELNSLFPHKLAELADTMNFRLVHFSTDCVFRGDKGNYSEDDVPDSADLYGRSKLLGEVVYSKRVLTLRAPFIGREIFYSGGLVEWFFRQTSETVSGYTRAIYSGFPTLKLAEIIEDHILPRPDLSGLLHISSDPINKHELLSIIGKVFNLKTNVQPNDNLIIDRSLSSQKFRALTGFKPEPWDTMISALAENRDLYRDLLVD